MKNNDTNTDMSFKENSPVEPAILNQNDSPQIKTANLDQKRDELLSDNKISDEVATYLNDLGVGNNSFPVANVARPLEEKKILKQSIVRTFKSDAENAIKTERMSSLSVAVAEEKKKQKYQPIILSDGAPKSKKAILFIMSLIFALAGIGAFNFSYIKEKIKVAPISENAFQAENLITTDLSVEFDFDKVDRKDFGNSLYEFMKTFDIKPNSIQNIHLIKKIIENKKETKKIADIKEFLQLISPEIPDILLRSLSRGYMLGSHSWNGNQPFIILKTDSYESAFAGMLSWEKNIAGDLSLFFPRNIPREKNEETITTEQVLSYKKNFEDILVKNKDARALRDETGEIFLIYSLPDKETVIITSNIDTLAELFNRIIRSRNVR